MSEWTGLPGIAKSVLGVKCFERFNGLDTALVQQPEGVTLQKYHPTRLLLILVEEVV